MWCDVKISICCNGSLYLQFYESGNKAFYNNTDQLRKHVIGPQVQIIPLEIIIHPFQSIVCLIYTNPFQSSTQIPNAEIKLWIMNSMNSNLQL